MTKIHSEVVGGIESRIGYKVVTEDLKSLGLRKNPNILTFPIGVVVELFDKDIVRGNGDWGGIWMARTISNAKKLQDYMSDKYDRSTRLFKATLDEVLFVNNYRIKTNAVKLYEEVHFY